MPDVRALRLRQDDLPDSLRHQNTPPQPGDRAEGTFDRVRTVRNFWLTVKKAMRGLGRMLCAPGSRSTAMLARGGWHRPELFERLHVRVARRIELLRQGEAEEL